ncbi:MAG: hypothetical protein A4E66_02538 [Syntrophus sp. PtaB.Bin001]|nr:MAG: hypothetical protein A4E66_02538 [Syntrophus sp. PtaB.Bin001]
MSGLPPEFRCGLFIVGQCVYGILELVRHISLEFLDEFLRFFHRSGYAFAVRSQNEISAENFDDVLSLFAHPFGHHDIYVVSLCNPDEGYSYSCIARCRFDDFHPRLQGPIPLCRLDHRQGDTVFDTASGIEKFSLGDNVFVSQSD